ncbi:Nuclear pore complex protein NUP205 [Chlorella vulgaris]
MEETNFRELLQAIETTLFDVQDEPSAESRAAVQSGKPLTPGGLVVLDPEPDIREILLLADELRLDEVLAVMCVQTAEQETGEVSAAAGAGIYFEERRGLLTSLWLVLQAQVMSADSLPRGLYQAICNFNCELLSHSVSDRTLVIQRLTDLIRANPLEAPPGSRLPAVIDSAGREVDRNSLVQREQTVLCECLVYACCISQRLTAADIADLVDLLHRLGLKARAGDGTDLSAQQQAYCVLLSILLALMPLENAVGAEAEADSAQLRRLTTSRELDQKIGGGLPDDPYWAVVKLTWGVLLGSHGSESMADRAKTLVKAATDSGALGWLKAGVLDSVPMQDDADHQRQLYASIINQLIMAYISIPVGKESIGALLKVSIEQGTEELAQSAQPAAPGLASASMSVDTAVHAPIAPKPDSLATLLCVLAAVYGMHPDLFLDETLVYEPFKEFMEEVAASDVIGASPSVFLAFVAVLTSLSSGEKGARSMYLQLRADQRFSMLNWKRMFKLLMLVVQRYEPEEGKELANGGTGSAPAGSSQRRSLSEQVLPACDSSALCAYLNLFRHVMSEGRVDEVLSWLRQLEEDAGVSPIWEVLFRAMCCPVPQELKAALDEAIGSLARRSDVTTALWERLLAAVVVAPISAEATAVPRYDLTYQLNEIEARAEDYSESLAFVHLLNALWRGGAQMADDGRGVAHFTRFVRDDVLGTAFQRAYKDEAQRWHLLAACFDHCRLCLAAPPSLAVFAAEAASSAAVKPPGVAVLLDLLGERNTLRAAMVTCLVEVDRLASERHASCFGAAKEAAVLAALRLLRVALDRDVELVAAMRQASHSSSYETMDVVMRHDRRRIPLLLDFVRYPHNPAVQAEAIRIATHLSARTPNLVSLLLNAPSTGSLPAVQRLQDGFAACLQSSLFNLAASVSLEDDASAPEADDAEAERDGDRGDPRAALLLNLLLTSLEQPQPNLTHLLCSFDFDAGMGQVFLPDPRTQYNVLRVLLNVVQAPALSIRKPALFEQALEIIYELAASPETGSATLGLLRGYYSLLAPLLETVADAPLPQDGEQCASSLHQRAWLLQCHALELHRADAALAHHAESLGALLAALFSSEPPEAYGQGDGLGQGRSRMLNLLDLVVSATPEEPQLGRDVHPEALELDALLAAGTPVQQGGVRTVSTRGVGLFDLSALKDELMKRHHEWVARHGGPSEALKGASKEALRFDMLAAAAGGGSVVDLVLQMAEECLRVLAELTAGSGIGLAPALCEAVQALLARLQEQVAAATTADPLAGMPLPARCHGLLQLLLEVTWQGRNLDAVRLPMYSSLASYLTLCRGPSLLRAPPPVVEALLQGMPGSGSAASQLDALQSQLEEGNAVLLHEAAPVLELLSADALSADPAQAAAALTALCAVLAADPSTGAADELYRATLPSRLLSDLQETPHRALTQPPPRGQALMLVVEAQLTLMLRLALAGPPSARSASAQRLFGLHVLAKLSKCRALDLQPEEPGFGQFGGLAGLRKRLHHLLTPLLRLVLAVVTALPNSAAVREQAQTLVQDHTRTLARDAELEEATLVVQLLAELAQARHTAPSSSAQLQEAAYRLSARFLCLSNKVLSLRCALSHYLLQLATDPRQPVVFRVSPPSLGGAGVGMEVAGLMPTLFLIKDAMLQAVVYDMPEVLEEEPQLLEALRSGGGDGGIRSSELALASPNGGTASAAPGAARSLLARAASAAGTQLNKLLYLSEHLMAVLYTQLRHSLPAPTLGSASPDKGMLAYDANGGSSATENVRPSQQALGSDRDLDQLRRLMEPVVAALESVTARLGTGAARRDVDSLQLLLSRLPVVSVPQTRPHRAQRNGLMGACCSSRRGHGHRLENDLGNPLNGEASSKAVAEPKYPGCPFCAIAQGGKNLVHETERLVVFRDKSPAGLEHLQVVPRHHVRNFDSLCPSSADHELVSAMVAAGRAALQALHPGAPQKLGFHRPPFNSVLHLHLHAIALPFRPGAPTWKYADSWLAPWWLPAETALRALEPPHKQGRAVH